MRARLLTARRKTGGTTASDSALASDADIELLTTHALRSQSLTVETGGSEGTTAHSFRMSGLLEALEELPCFSSFLVGSGG